MKKFWINLAGAITAGLEAGVDAKIFGGAANLTPAEMLSKAKDLTMGELIKKVGQVAAANQAIEILTGERKDFDLGRFISQVLTAAVMYKIAPTEDKFFNVKDSEFAGKFMYTRDT